MSEKNSWKERKFPSKGDTFFYLTGRLETVSK